MLNSRHGIWTNRCEFAPIDQVKRRLLKEFHNNNSVDLNTFNLNPIISAGERRQSPRERFEHLWSVHVQQGQDLLNKHIWESITGKELMDFVEGWDNPVELRRSETTTQTVEGQSYVPQAHAQAAIPAEDALGQLLYSNSDLCEQ